MGSRTSSDQKISGGLRIRTRMLLWLIGFLTVASGLWVASDQLLTVRTIDCHLDTGECEPAVQGELEQALRGKSLFFTDISQALGSLPSLQSLHVTHIQKKLPTTILIFLEGEQLLYQLQLVEGKTRLVGEHGSLKNAGESTPKNLPIVELRSEDSQQLAMLRDAPQMPSELHSVFTEVIAALQANHITFQKISWFSADEIRVQSEPYQAILDSQNPAGSVEALAQILSSEEVKQLPKPLKEIDLRFTLPVLRTQE